MGFANNIMIPFYLQNEALITVLGAETWVELSPITTTLPKEKGPAKRIEENNH